VESVCRLLEEYLKPNWRRKSLVEALGTFAQHSLSTVLCMGHAHNTAVNTGPSYCSSRSSKERGGKGRKKGRDGGRKEKKG
jgi:hypothetical protein